MLVKVLLVVGNRNQFWVAKVFFKKEIFIERILGHLKESMKLLNRETQWKPKKWDHPGILGHPQIPRPGT